MSKSVKQKIELKAQKREILGKKVARLREDGFLPAVLYGKKVESLSLQIPAKEFEKVFKEAGESTLIYLEVDGNEYPVIIHDVAKDPVDDTIMHADFYKVRLDEKIKSTIPVVFDGSSPAVEDLNGILVRNVNELEVEALPQDLPSEISVDISTLKNLNDQVLVRNINLGDKVKLFANEDDIVATIQAPKSQEEFEAELSEPTTDVSAVEEIKREKPEEGEEPAKGKDEEAKPGETKEG